MGRGGLTCQCALNAVKMGKDVGSRGPGGPWRDGPQMGLQSIE